MINEIYNEDCLSGIQKLDNNIINLVITSPPYNLDKVTNKKKIIYNEYKDDKPFFKYIEWLEIIFKEIYRVLTEDGRVCINIGDQKNGSIPTHYYITDFMLNIGYRYYTTIIWNKSQISNRTSWGSWLSSSCPSFPTPFEYVLVFYKDSKKLLHKGKTDLEKKEFIDWALSIWNFAPEHRMKKYEHPAMFPLELPKRCIKMFSWINDIVLDPFSGIGTTCLASKKLNRRFIGFENDIKYYNRSIQRLEEEYERIA